jgi:hypothetical protein
MALLYKTRSTSQSLSCTNFWCKHRVHPAYEYWGQFNSTRVVKPKVSKEEMAVRVKGIFAGCIRNCECPKALGVYRPSDVVSF